MWVGFFVQAHVMEFSSFKHTSNAPTSVAASPMKGERAVPALLTMMRWSADVPSDAVLLSPSDVRQTWQEFLTVRSHHLSHSSPLLCTVRMCMKQHKRMYA